MKILPFLISVCLAFVTSWAGAYPRVGDKVQWQGNIKLKAGAVTPVHITKEVIGFNETTKKWSVKYIATVGDQVTTEFLETADLYTPSRHKKLISNCQSAGGSLESLNAPAGKYETCKLTTKTDRGVIIEKMVRGYFHLESWVAIQPTQGKTPT